MFRTTDEAPQRTPKEGTGLALAIGWRGVEAQGGTLEAESSGPVGCHVWIRFRAPRGAAG